jgi:uncharacterized protein YecT (DUF1311 family)
MALYKALLLSSLLFTVFQCHAQTVKEDRIDEDYDKCLAVDTSYATICDCAFIAYGKWDKEMDHTYDKLLKTLKKDKDKTSLKASQKAWIAYREAEFNTYNNIFNLPGNKWCGVRQDGRIEIVRARTLQLRTYIESLDKH